MTRSMISPTAFSPASITAFFQPVFGDTPAKTVSRGLAFCLNGGVSAAVSPARSNVVQLNGVPIPIAPVLSVLEALAPEPVEVILESTLPLGTGFGLSAACALSTAFAIEHRFQLGKSRHELGMIAHVAEVSSLTGLGDVAAQLCGGIVFRNCDSGPLDVTQLQDVPAAPVYCRYFGPLSTKGVLKTPERLSALQAAGGRAVEWLRDRASVSNPIPLTLKMLLDRSLLFAEEAGFLTNPEVNDAIQTIRQHEGGAATMMMLGYSVIATTTQPPGDSWRDFEIDKQGTRFL